MTSAISLFAGCGGLDYGAGLAGIDITAAYELSPSACAVYPRVTGHHNIIEADLSQFDFSRSRGVDGLIGGPPCQAFSEARKQSAGETDSKNMWPVAVRAVREIHPRWFLFENVPGMLIPKHVGYFYEILRILTALGYRVDWRVLNAADYGVPQTRRRVFIAGRRDGGEWTWPEPTHAKLDGGQLDMWQVNHVSVETALSVWFETAPTCEMPNWIMKFYPHGFADDRLYNTQNGSKNTWKRDRPISVPSFTVTIGLIGAARIIRNGTIYRLDKCAGAILQTLPYAGGLTTEHIGNAVPPLLAQRLFQAVTL